MKKILLAALIALCGVSFGFGENTRMTCERACLDRFQTMQEQNICLVNECGYTQIVARTKVKVKPNDEISAEESQEAGGNFKFNQVK